MLHLTTTFETLQYLNEVYLLSPALVFTIGGLCVLFFFALTVYQIIIYSLPTKGKLSLILKLKKNAFSYGISSFVFLTLGIGSYILAASKEIPLKYYQVIDHISDIRDPQIFQYINNDYLDKTRHLLKLSIKSKLLDDNKVSIYEFSNFIVEVQDIRLDIAKQHELKMTNNQIHLKNNIKEHLVSYNENK